MTEHRDVIDSQRTYYDERAEDYLDMSKPSDRRVRGADPREQRALIRGFAPSGEVLELACGSGESSAELVRYADSLTVVDGSPRMIERCRLRVAGADVRFIVADIFDWEPDRTYDAVFFSFWLSHVPFGRFHDFWSLVRRCLKPGGRIAFIDEDDRAASHDDTRIVDGESLATRMLADGRTYDIVKVFWHPDDLEDRLRSMGLDIAVRRAAETFLFGSGGIA